MARLNRQFIHLKSATLVEAIVAVLIISISFSIGIMIFLNSIQHIKNNTKSKIEMDINNILHLTKSNEYYIDESLKFDQYTIEKKVSNYQFYDDVLAIEFTVKNKRNKTIFKRLDLVYIEK